MHRYKERNLLKVLNRINNQGKCLVANPDYFITNIKKYYGIELTHDNDRYLKLKQ